MARLAARQHGVVARRQLLAAGVGPGAIRHRLSTGRLHKLWRGVYAVGQPRLSSRGTWMAAVLAAGPGAVLSHWAAAALWGLVEPGGGPVHVTVGRRGTAERRATGERRGTGPRGRLITHSTRRLSLEDITIRHGIPCTTVERTLLDLAAVASPAALERVLEQAFILRLLHRPRLEAMLAAASRRRGVAALRRLLAQLHPALPFTRSELERRFVKLTAAAGLPELRVNQPLQGHLVDFHWPSQRLVVETDGAETHDTPQGFHRDRRRDLDLELAGWHVVRLTWAQVLEQPERVVALLRRRLDYAGGSVTEVRSAP